jgi:hypothetical protein
MTCFLSLSGKGTPLGFPPIHLDFKTTFGVILSIAIKKIK